MPKGARAESSEEGNAAKKARETVLEWGEQTEAQRAATMTQMVEKLNSLSLHHVLLKDALSLLAQSETEAECMEMRKFLVEGVYPPSHTDQYAEFLTFVSSKIADGNESAIPGVCVGDQAPPTSAFSVSRKEEVPIPFGSQVVLLTFWLPDDIAAVKQLRKIAEEHKDWVNKARIVCVSLESDTEQPDDLTDMPLVTHLCKGEEAAIKWGVLPQDGEYILIDAAGMVVKRGVPTDFNVTQDITSVIAGRGVATEEKKLAPGQWGNVTDDARRALLLRMAAIIREGDLRGLTLRSDSETTFTSKGQKGVEDARLFIAGVVSHKQEPVMVRVCNELHGAGVLDVEHEFSTMPKLLGEDEGDDEGDEPDRVPKLPLNCSECKASLADAKVRYLCACCPSPYYVICEACEGRRSTSTHPGYHVFFVVPPTGWSEECHFTVGDLTTWPVFTDAISRQEPEVYCDGCQQSLASGTRFDCVQCDDHDLCPKCFNSLKSDNPHSGHVWIKIHEPRGCRLTVAEDSPFEGGDEGDFDFGGEEDADVDDGRIQLR